MATIKPKNDELSPQNQRRRQLVLGLLASVGAINIAGCVAQFESTTTLLTGNKNLHDVPLEFYSAPEYQLVSQLADLIIPDTETPGALSIGVPILMDKLHFIWASEQTQKRHRTALAVIKNTLDEIAQNNFLTLTKSQQIAALQTLDTNAFSGQYRKLSGYKNVKKLIAEFYYLSEVGATQELRYKPVPGKWEGCIPLKENDRTWAV